jgi:hypothetical protein
MKFNADRHFTYITAHAYEHKQQLQSYYKLKEYDLEEITKEWSTGLLVAADSTEMSDVDSPEAMSDTPGPRKPKKDVEVQDIHNTSTNTASLSPAKGGDEEELGGKKLNRAKATLPCLGTRQIPPRKGRLPHRGPHPERKLRPPKPCLRLCLPQMILTS